MCPGEICLASFPFGDTAGMKLRPVLVLAGPVGPIPKVLVAYISSVLLAALMPSSLVLEQAGRAVTIATYRQAFHHGTLMLSETPHSTLG
jgi:hypothetical protein